MIKPKNVVEYIASCPKESHAKLHEMRACLRKVAPDAQESIKWSMIAFSYKRILFMFAGFKHHIGFYPTQSAMRPFVKELSKYKTGKGSIQFPLDKPLPTALIRKIAAFRVKESKEKDARWM